MTIGVHSFQMSVYELVIHDPVYELIGVVFLLNALEGARTCLTVFANPQGQRKMCRFRVSDDFIIILLLLLFVTLRRNLAPGLAS